MSPARPLVVATRNAHKTAELAALLGPAWQVRDLTGAPDLPEPEETGATFEANAIIKALAASVALPGLVLADDSGLAVEALGGAPGIYSARYAGPHATDWQNRDYLLAELARVAPGPSEFAASFHCCLALAREGKILQTFSGELCGRVTLAAAGGGGFGYDPVFIPAGYEQTLGELPPETKNRISHRSQALARAVPWLARLAG